MRGVARDHQEQCEQQNPAFAVLQRQHGHGADDREYGHHADRGREVRIRERHLQAPKCQERATQCDPAIQLLLPHHHERRRDAQDDDRPEHELEAGGHAQQRQERYREQHRDRTIDEEHEHDERQAHDAHPEVQADAQPHDIGRDQQRSDRGLLAVRLPPPQPQPEHEDLREAHELVDLGLDRVLPPRVREREQQRAGRGRDHGDPLMPHLALFTLGDADQSQRRQIGEEDRDRRRDRGQGVDALRDRGDRDQGRDARQHHEERRARRVRDTEDVRDRDELARVPERDGRRERHEVDGRGQQQHQDRDQRGRALGRDHSVDLRGFRDRARRLGMRARNTNPPSRLTPTATR